MRAVLLLVGLGLISLGQASPVGLIEVPQLKSLTSFRANSKFALMATVGNPCSSDPCTSSFSCGWNSLCVGSGSTGVCTIPSLVQCGATCANTSQVGLSSAAVCQGDSAGCQDSSTGATKVCYPFPSETATTGYAHLGCSCTVSTQCASPSTCQNSICSLSGLGLLPVGATCVNNNDCGSTTCTSSKCAARSNCTMDSHCATGMWCNTTLGGCVSPLAIGMACTSGTQCAALSSCVSSSCVGIFSLATDASCVSTFFCQPGLSCNPKTGKCGPPMTQCDPLYGSAACLAGQSCACSGGMNATCSGVGVTQACVTKYMALVPVCSTELNIPAAAPNFVPPTGACLAAVLSLACDRSCTGPGMFFNTDMNLLSCSTSTIVPYTSSQTFGCAASYCPNYNAGARSSLADVTSVAVLAVFTAAVASFFSRLTA